MTEKFFRRALAVIVIMAACVPLFSKNCIGGHDIIYHLLRIEALKEGICAGRPFLRINMLFFGGTGYASSMFYPDFLLYFPALLRSLGAGIGLSYHLFIALCIVLGFISSYYCAGYISKNQNAAIATAIIFTLYQYHIFDIYERSAVGEFTAVIFLPFVIAGLYDLVYERFERPWLLFVGMTGVILCHTITTVICLGLCVLMVLIGIKTLIKEPKRILKLIITALAVIGITAFYWLPALEILASGVLKNDFVYNMELESAGLWELFFNEWNRPGAVIFVLLLVRLLIGGKNKAQDKDDRTEDRFKLIRFADICMVTGLLLCLCATSILPWGRLQRFLGFLQFPWRLFVAAGPLLAFAEGIYVNQLASGMAIVTGSDEKAEENRNRVNRVALIMLTGIMLISAFSNLQKCDQEYYSYSDDYFKYKPFTTDVLGGEWLPAAVTDREALADISDMAVDDEGREYPVTRIKNELEVSGILDKCRWVDVPFVYYKGYGAYNTAAGEVLAVTGEGENGLVRVYTNGAEKIRVWYKGTTLQLASDVITLITFAGVAVYMIIKRKKLPIVSSGL